MATPPHVYIGVPTMKGLLADFSAGKLQEVLFDRSFNNGAVVVKMNGSVLEEKSSFEMLGLFSLLNWIGALTLFLLLKLPPRKLEPWLVLWSFFLLRLQCLCKTIRPCMEYCCPVGTGTSNCYLNLLGKLQKRICRTVGPSLAAPLEVFFSRGYSVSL